MGHGPGVMPAHRKCHDSTDHGDTEISGEPEPWDSHIFLFECENNFKHRWTYSISLAGLTFAENKEGR